MAITDSGSPDQRPLDQRPLEQRMQSNGIELAYDVRGSGPAVLLVMGLGAQMIAWREDFCDAIAEAGHTVIRFDNRDVGRSTMIDAPAPSPAVLLRKRLTKRTPDAPYVLSDMAADALGLLDGLGIDQAHVVGVSMGGMIAQTMAIEAPERVLSLCSIMSTTGNPKKGNAAPAVLAKMAKAQDRTRESAVADSTEFFRLISGPHFDPDEHAAMVEATLARSFDQRGVARQMAAIMASPDRTRRLRKLDLPTLVIHGLRDKLVRPSGGIATAKAIPNSRLLMFNDMAHDLPAPRRDEIIEAMLANMARAGVSVTA